MSTALAPFAFDGQQVRTELIDGEPWFVASDVAKILGYRMASDMTRRLDEDDRGTRSVRTPSGGEQDMSVISEPGLFAAIFGSQVPGAQSFKRWVTSVVLPQIRKTGTYSPVKPDREQALALGLQAMQEVLAEHVQAIAALTPKAEFYDDLMNADGLYSVEAAAKLLGYGRNILYRDLRRLGVLQGNNLPYQRYMHHFEVKPGTYTNRNTGELHPTATTYVRPAGLEFLRRKLAGAAAVTV